MADIVALDQPCMSRGNLEQLEGKRPESSSSVAGGSLKKKTRTRTRNVPKGREGGRGGGRRKQ